MFVSWIYIGSCQSEKPLMDAILKIMDTILKIILKFSGGNNVMLNINHKVCQFNSTVLIRSKLITIILLESYVVLGSVGEGFNSSIFLITLLLSFEMLREKTWNSLEGKIDLMKQHVNNIS